MNGANILHLLNALLTATLQSDISEAGFCFMLHAYVRMGTQLLSGVKRTGVSASPKTLKIALEARKKEFMSDLAEKENAFPLEIVVPRYPISNKVKVLATNSKWNTLVAVRLTKLHHYRLFSIKVRQ